MDKSTVGNGLALLSLLTEKVCLFEGLSTKEVAWILRRATKRELNAEAVLIEPAVRQGRMYVILSGEISIRGPQQGKFEEIAILGPGASVGEMALIDSEPRSAVAICSSPATVLEFDENWLRGSPPSLGFKVYRNFSRILAQRVRNTNALIDELKALPNAGDELERQLLNLGLNGLDLTGIDATEARFSRADLSGVDLRGANLSGADLRGAIFDGTDLRQTDLTKAVSDPSPSEKTQAYWQRFEETVKARGEQFLESSSASVEAVALASGEDVNQTTGKNDENKTME